MMKCLLRNIKQMILKPISKAENPEGFGDSSLVFYLLAVDLPELLGLP